MSRLTQFFGFGISRRPTILPVDSSGSAATVAVGNTTLIPAAIEVSGSTINSYVSPAVTDIDDPASTGGWDVIFTHSDSQPFLVDVGRCTNTEALIALRTTSAETSGKALRCQILVDGIVVADGKILSDGVLTANLFIGYQVPDNSFPIFCQSSFVVRFARVGDFADANSKLEYGTFAVRTL